MITIPNRKIRLGGYQAGKLSENRKYHQIGRFRQKELPAKVDLRKYMTAVEEQVGNNLSC